MGCSSPICSSCESRTEFEDVNVQDDDQASLVAVYGEVLATMLLCDNPNVQIEDFPGLIVAGLYHLHGLTTKVFADSPLKEVQFSNNDGVLSILPAIPRHVVERPSHASGTYPEGEYLCAFVCQALKGLSPAEVKASVGNLSDFDQYGQANQVEKGLVENFQHQYVNHQQCLEEDFAKASQEWGAIYQEMGLGKV